MKEAVITKALQSKGALTVTLLALLFSSVYAVDNGMPQIFDDNDGFVFNSPAQWFSSPLTSLAVNFIVELAVIGIMIFINKVYSIPRSITLSYAVFFAVLQTATPEISARFYSGSLLCLLIAFCMAMMFASFANAGAQRRVFLIFLSLSAASTVQYAFLVYVPVFLIACAQMRIFGLRTVIAALLGLLTPWCLLLGFDIISPAQINLPQFENPFVSLGSNIGLALALTAALTATVTITAYALSWLKLMTYNAVMRGCNGLLSLITFVTILAMAIDFTNFIAYMPLLNFCCAMMLGHLFVIRNSPKAWISIISIVIIYYCLLSWRITALTL